MGKNMTGTVALITMTAVIGMMYPKYCFADGTYRIIIEEHGNREEITTMNEQDLYGLLRADPDHIRIKSKLLEYIQK
ncbi:MAG: hypothetical protein PHE02_13190 [Lachnospiraceae bacterium]|nr:hypothetical protein [Lachnospiraceae bacterium]